MSQSAALLSVATATPAYSFEQSEVAAVAEHAFASRFGAFKRLSRVFESSGILRRYAVRPLEWYFEPLGWPERNAAYLDGALELFINSASKALDAAGIKSTEVDAVVTIFSTGSCHAQP